MPEGDTVYRTARTLNDALAGHTLELCDIRVPRYATVDLSGDTIEAVVPRGKHILMRIGDHSIHSHLKMEGAWHLYSPGTRWKQPAHTARAVLGTSRHIAVGFSLGLLEVLPRSAEADAVGHLGPDLLGPDWDTDEALRRILSRPERPVFYALLDQTNLAGLGNVYANELCFLRGVLPSRPVGEVEHPEKLVDLAYRLIMANRDRSERVTTGNLRRGPKTWVYGRGGSPCLRCGTALKRKDGSTDAEFGRISHWCPNCQR